MKSQSALRTAICFAALLPTAAMADDFDYAGALARIAGGIAGLKRLIRSSKSFPRPNTSARTGR